MREEIGGHSSIDFHARHAPGGDVLTGIAAQFGAGAIIEMATKGRMPPSPIPIHPSEQGDDKIVKTKHLLPPSPIPIHPSQQGAKCSLLSIKEMPLVAILDRLDLLQTQRTFCIKSQSRCDRSVEAMIARFLGYRADQAEKDRKAVWKQALAIRKMVEGGEGQSKVDTHSNTALSACSKVIRLSAESRKAWDNHRTQVEKEMRGLARKLPVWPWVEQVRGFGDLGLAIVLAETRDLSNYETKERVWKRLGLAVIDGERQQRKTGTEAAAAHGYNPRRRAEVWTLFSDSMFRGQWAAAKDEDGKNPVLTKKPIAVEAHPIGPYGEIYAQRKVHTALLNDLGAYATRAAEIVAGMKRAKKTPLKDNLEGRLTPSHRHNDARRIMTKAVIEDLWKEWRKSVPVA